MNKLGLILMMLLPLQWVVAQELEPYILGFETTASVSVIKADVADQLKINGIQIVGEYQPANDDNRWVMVITSKELKGAVSKVGGLSGFAATLRVAVTDEGEKTIVSYTNPTYWGNAYFRNDFARVAGNYEALTANIEKSMKALGTFAGTPFGSDKGMVAADLHKYRYMLGMPRFESTVKLETFDTYASARDKIDGSVKKGVPNLELVYKVEFSDKEIALYGFGLSGEKGEGKFLPIIDISEPKHTAFLPYEILVMGNEVHMLHGRFRIALSFPDLKMGTFTKIMSTPGNIKDMLRQLVEEGNM